MNSCSTGSGAPPEVSERQTDSQSRTCAANASGIDASAPIRARTSPERLVSCVWVTSRLRGKRSARSRLPRGTGRPRREPARVAADVVQGQQPRVAVERRVLDALGHHRRRRLLEARHERVPARPLEQQDLAQRALQARPRPPPRGRRPRPGPTTARRRCGRPAATPARAPAPPRAPAPRAAAARPRARTSSAPARAWPRRPARRTAGRRRTPRPTGRSAAPRRPGRRTARATSLRNS